MNQVLGAVIAAVFAVFDPEDLRMAIDDFLDTLEDKVAAMPAGPKQVAASKAIEFARETLKIDDDIGGDED